MSGSPDRQTAELIPEYQLVSCLFNKYSKPIPFLSKQKLDNKIGRVAHCFQRAIAGRLGAISVTSRMPIDLVFINAPASRVQRQLSADLREWAT